MAEAAPQEPPEEGGAANAGEGTEGSAEAKVKVKAKKPFSSHRPDDEVPGAAAIIANLKVAF